MAAPAQHRPKPFPPPEFPARRLPLFARMPPAVFPTIMGLFGLGLALRAAGRTITLLQPVAETALGAIAALWLFAAIGYGVKYLRRPAVLAEDLRVLPGRAGIAAMVLGGLLLAVVLVPYAPGLARAVLVGALLAHLALAVLVLWLLSQSPPDQREVTPVWHLNFVGFIIGGVAAVPLGWPGLAQWVLLFTMPVAGAIAVVSVLQLIRRIPPAPLRPLLAIHLAPPSLFAIVAGHLGWPALAVSMAVLAAVVFVVLLFTAQWMLAAGFSALWGALTFPLAAFATALITLGFVTMGVLVLVIAVGLIPFVSYRVLKGWTSGDLAARTNAATA